MEFTSEGREAEIPNAAGPRRRQSGVGSDLGALVILMAISLVAGCAFNALRARPLAWVYKSRAEALDASLAQLGNPHKPPPDPSELPHEIRLDDFQSFVAERKGLVLDARAAVFYQAAHVPGAVNLPREGFAEEFSRLRPTLEPAKNGPIAIYCSGADCPDSELLSEALTKLGFQHLLIYTAGWDEWSQTGLPQEGTSAQP